MECMKEGNDAFSLIRSSENEPCLVSSVWSCHNSYDPAAIFSEIVLSLRDSSCDICHEQQEV